MRVSTEATLATLTTGTEESPALHPDTETLTKAFAHPDTETLTKAFAHPDKGLRSP